MKWEEEFRVRLRDEFVAAYHQSTGENLLELSRHAKEEYYDPLRKDMRKYLKKGENDKLLSAVCFRSFIFWLHVLNYAPSTIHLVKSYIKAVQIEFPVQEVLNNKIKTIEVKKGKVNALDTGKNSPIIAKVGNKQRVKKSTVNVNPYVISFVVSKMANLGNDVYLEIVSQFKSIVSNDQRLIYENNKGLAQALYYFSCLHKEYDIYMTWEAFLKVVDYYNENTKSSTQLLRFPQFHSVYAIISSYIFLEELVHPAHLNQHLFYFKDDVLVEEISKKPHCKEWVFNETVKTEFATILLRTHPFQARDWYSTLKRENILSGKLELEFKNTISRSFLIDLIVNQRIKHLYNNVRKITDDDYWIDQFLFMACGLVSPHNDYHKMVLDKLLSDGCTSELVLRQSKIRRTKLFDDLYDLDFLYDFKQYEYRDYKNMVFGKRDLPIYQL